MKFTKTFLLALTSACLIAPGAAAQAANSEEAQVKAYIDMMRKDLRTEKQSVVDQAMGLEAGEKAKFWAVYEKYQGEMKVLWDQRLATIKKYADNYEAMTDAVADQLANASVANQQQEVAIRKKYYAQMKAALGPKTAARFLQVEMSLAHIIGLQLAAEIPLIH